MDAVIVRFKETPSDEEIDSLAKEIGLGEWHRNEFVDRQVYYQAPAGFSGALLLQIKRYGIVEMAWEDKLSEYRKEWARQEKAAVH